MLNDDTLNSEEIELEAKTENLDRVTAFLEDFLEKAACPMKALMQINIAADEIFTNISSYAYDSGIGKARLIVKMNQAPRAVELTFIDSGIPYNPLEKEDPDVTIPLAERKIGGLGIFMTKKLMDQISYTYENGKNILTLKKLL